MPDKPKKPKGRPARPPVKGIPDSLESVAQSVVKTRTKAERDALKD